MIYCHSLPALSSISLTNGPGKKGETEILRERDRERVMGERQRQGEMAIYERGGGKGQQLGGGGQFTVLSMWGLTAYTNPSR